MAADEVSLRCARQVTEAFCLHILRDASRSVQAASWQIDDTLSRTALLGPCCRFCGHGLLTALAVPLRRTQPPWTRCWTWHEDVLQQCFVRSHLARFCCSGL